MKQHIPNLFTLANLFCGCIAIVFAFEGSLAWAAYMVGIACVFDFLDGLVARALKVHSELGKQLDSLADVVSFGVVPGVILFDMIKNGIAMRVIANSDLGDFENPQIEAYFAMMNRIDPWSYIAFLIPVFSAVRLAKFNLDTRQADSFIGLPTPANAIFISSLALIVESDMSKYFKGLIILNPSYLIPLVFISSYLLIAPLPLFAFKFKTLAWSGNQVRYIFIVMAAGVLIIFKLVGIPLIIVLYILLSVVNNLFLKRDKKQD